MAIGEVPIRRKRNRRAMIIGAIAIAVVLIFALVFNGFLINLSFGLFGKDLVKVGNETLTTADAYVLLYDVKCEYEDVFGENVWNTKIGNMSANDYAKQQLMVKMQRLAAIANVAQKRGIVLTRDARNNVSKAATEYLNGVDKAIEDNLGISHEQMENLFSLFALAKQVYGDITDDLKVEVSADAARVITIQYVVTESEEDAKAALNRISDGEAFAVMIKDYGGSVDGSTVVKRGEMDKAFEDVAFELKAGEVSKIVNVGDKYYIIKCVSDNEKTLSDTNKVALINEKKLAEFNKIVEAYEIDALIELAEGKWEKINVADTPDLRVSFNEIFSKYF